MRQDKLSKTNIILYAFGIIPVIWLSLLIAPYTTNGLVGIVKNFSEIMDNPFHIDDTNFAVYSSEEIEEILRNESEVYANEKK